ncbi:MAG: hypothetical protein IT579_02975 [Verrucomicrobia subdivision 3 bacterium]|nr:hypothetical protein [Limisphaerales bacterium]
MNSVKSKSEIQPTSQVQDGGFGRSAIRVPFLLQRLAALTVALLTLLPRVTGAASSTRFDGPHYRGVGDTEYLQLLETARRMFEPDARLQNLAMLYMPAWNGLVEGPTWDAWWIQNSYGTTYAILPFLREPFLTFLQNSQDLWFDQMGDGKRAGATPPFDWVAPDGCLCDAARPGWIVYKQGDGRTKIHDWGMEFTAAGLVLQSELLLISRDAAAIAHYLPKLERCAAFIETRRDPQNNLFLAGPAGNLLAPSYAGWRRPDGTYDKAYLTGLSITYLAALDRLIELEKLAGRSDQAQRFVGLRASAKQGLQQLTTDEGYFIRSLDPDGTRHGVYGAAQHGYFEASPNHDAIAFRIADDAQAEKIFQKVASLPGLRPFAFILPNFPGYDDMYEKPEGLWGYGTWVNGGHWSTCEARMVLAYYRLGKFDDARRSMRQLLTFAEKFRMDNPLVKFGSDVYQPKQPVNLTYDAFGPPAAFLRGLFEYLYRADGLTLVPHIPPGVTELEQRDPVRFGKKQLLVSMLGRGELTAVRVNGRNWKTFDGQSVFLAYDKTPDTAHVEIFLGGAKPSARQLAKAGPVLESKPLRTKMAASAGQLESRVERVRAFHQRLVAGQLGNTYEATHAKLILDFAEVIAIRRELLLADELRRLPEPSQTAADKSYDETLTKLYDGLDAVLKSYERSPDAARSKVFQLWRHD